MSNGNEPAYPVIETQPRDIGAGGVYVTIADTYSSGGLTKREAFAMAAMQGLAANPGGPWQANASNGWALTNCSLADVAEVAVQAADALLAELAKEPK
jgi:hypothetical protein